MPKRSVWFALLGCLSLVSGPMAGGRQTLPENQGRAPAQSEPILRANLTLAPDGLSLAWTTQHTDTATLWEAPWRDLAAAQRIATVPGNVTRLEYVGGSTHIAIAHGNALSALELASGTLRRVGPEEASVKLLATSAQVPGTILVGINARDARYFDVWRADVRTGALQLVREHPGVTGGWFIHSFAFDDALRVRLLIGRSAEGGRVLLQSTKTAGSEEAVLPIGAGQRGDVRWYSFRADMPVVYCLDKTPTGSVLRAVDLSTSDEVTLYEGVGAQVDRVLMRADGTGVQAIRITQSNSNVFWSVRAPSIEQDFIAIRRAVVMSFDVVERSSDDQTWLLRVEDALGTHDAVYTKATRQVQRLTFPTTDTEAPTENPEAQAPDDR